MQSYARSLPEALEHEHVYCRCCSALGNSYNSTQMVPTTSLLLKAAFLFLTTSMCSLVSARRSSRPDTSDLQQNGQLVVQDVDHEQLRHSVSAFPGDETVSSSFFYCPESDPDNDILVFSKIVLNPNPVRINYVWVLRIHGGFREETCESQTPFSIHARVRNEDREGIDFTIEKPFCDFVDLVEMDGRSTICPPLKGNSTIHKFEFVDFGISEVRHI